VPVAPDVVEDVLFCRLDKLCRRTIDAVLAGRGPAGARPTLPTLPRRSVMPTGVPSVGRFPPTTFRSAVARESKLKSFAAVAILLWRSSKLGEGRNS
jgi:hypothetical protein